MLFTIKPIEIETKRAGKLFVQYLSCEDLQVYLDYCLVDEKDRKSRDIVCSYVYGCLCDFSGVKTFKSIDDVKAEKFTIIKEIYDKAHEVLDANENSVEVIKKN